MRITKTGKVLGVTNDKSIRTLDANQQLHSQLAPQYETDEPHFRPENRSKVRDRMRSVSKISGNCEVMVDLGCGTGFLEELAPEEFKVIYGVDATDAMLEILRGKNIPRVEIIRAPVEDIPLRDGIADLVTGYSVLDHFEDSKRVFGEAARLLRPDGVFYMDLIPNGEFWQGIRRIASRQKSLHPIVEREILEVASHSQKIYERYGVPQEVLAAAEPHKELTDGFFVEELAASLLASGFVDVQIHYEWFLGEATVLHGDGLNTAAIVAEHLRRLSPLSNHLFKYLWFTGRRNS